MGCLRTYKFYIKDPSGPQRQKKKENSFSFIDENRYISVLLFSQASGPTMSFSSHRKWSNSSQVVMRASQYNKLQQISVKIDIINFGCSIINQQLLWNCWTYYTPITRRRTRSLVENTNSIDIPAYSFMLNLCRPFSLFKAGDNFQKKEEQVIIWTAFRLYFKNYLLFHT